MVTVILLLSPYEHAGRGRIFFGTRTFSCSLGPADQSRPSRLWLHAGNVHVKSKLVIYLNRQPVLEGFD